MTPSSEAHRSALLRPVLAANWKMNHTPEEARRFVDAYAARVPVVTDRTVILFPPALSLAAARAAAASRTDIQFGVQNVYWEAKGAFTGEVSAPMARASGAGFVLVGHSERRHLFHESDADTARKCEAVIAAGLTPVLCVGEQLAEREAGLTHQVVVRQLTAGLSRLLPEQVARAVIAYEPVWAIGTGRTATPADASEAHAALADSLWALLPRDGPMIPILYGGSVNPGNCPSLLAADGVDGLLVGGASLDPASWADIVMTAVPI